MTALEIEHIESEFLRPLRTAIETEDIRSRYFRIGMIYLGS
jgi:hypothetical protein